MENYSIKKIFDGDLIVNNMIRDLSAALPGAKFLPNETVIIFDEMQECVNARSAIKPFMIDGRFDIIATGSLLGLRGYNKKKSKGVPTGFEYPIIMYPMDFEEYLLAKGIGEEVISYIKKCFLNKEKVSDVINNSFMKYFKEYLCIGGMPDAVNTFLQTSDLNQVFDVQSSILEQYKDDFGKHLDENEKEVVNNRELVKIMQVYNSIPNQLAKENKKFQYSMVNKDAKAREYRNAITWLEEFGLVRLCYNLNNLELPLEGNKMDDVFKLYVADTGLFVAMLEKGTTNNILNGDLKVYKGAIFENIIADAFSKMDRKLYYYHKDSGLEIDFVTRMESEPVLIEVKATTGNTKSSNYILEHYNEYKVNKCIMLGEYNIGETEKKLTIPYYLAFLLQ